MGRDLAADESASFVHAFQVLARHAPRGRRRRLDGIEVAATGVDHAWFNPAFVVGAVDDPERALRRVAAEFEGVAARFAVHVVDGGQPGLEAAAIALGLEAVEGIMPGMAQHPITAPDARTGLEITEVSSATAWDELCRATVEPFGLTPAIVAGVFPPAVREAAGTHWFLGRLDGETIGTAATIVHGDVAGIYNIGVLEAHRGQGHGWDLTAAAVRAGISDGCSVAVLQSSDAGLGIYERMGFRTVNRYRTFVGGPGR